MAISSRKSSPNSSSSKLNKKMMVNKKPLNRSSPPKKRKVVAEAKGGVVKREYTSVDENSLAMKRAQEIQANLSPEFPSLVKFMLHSHVNGGFWLGLPKTFCTSHLPKHDAAVVLVDEDKKESETKFLAGKNGLSAGWRGFSIAHNLIAGDVLVFQLVEPCKFKVYIVRESTSTDLDFAISLLNLSHHPIAIDREASMSDHGPESGLDFASDTANSSQLSGDLKLAESGLDFAEVKDFESFNIFVNGLIIDSDIPKDLRTKYYQLCRIQGSYLHHHLIQGLNYKLIAGIISETVNIADAIRASKLTTTGCSHLESWDATLRGFECVGMRVEFLRARLSKLISLSRESSKDAESKRRRERRLAEDEMKDLKTKMRKVKEAIRSLDMEMEIYREKDRVEMMFKDVATAPW